MKEVGIAMMVAGVVVFVTMVMILLTIYFNIQAAFGAFAAVLLLGGFLIYKMGEKKNKKNEKNNV